MLGDIQISLCANLKSSTEEGMQHLGSCTIQGQLLNSQNAILSTVQTLFTDSDLFWDHGVSNLFLSRCKEFRQRSQSISASTGPVSAMRFTHCCAVIRRTCNAKLMYDGFPLDM
jgi:hypothetical protein